MIVRICLQSQIKCRFFRQRALNPYPSSQFCCLRLLPGLLHILNRRLNAPWKES